MRVCVCVSVQEGQVKSEGTLVFCSHSCFLLYSAALQAKIPNSKVSPHSTRLRALTHSLTLSHPRGQNYTMLTHAHTRTHTHTCTYTHTLTRTEARGGVTRSPVPDKSTLKYGGIRSMSISHEETCILTNKPLFFSLFPPSSSLLLSSPLVTSFPPSSSPLL